MVRYVGLGLGYTRYPSPLTDIEREVIIDYLILHLIRRRWSRAGQGVLGRDVGFAGPVHGGRLEIWIPLSTVYIRKE